MLLAYLDEIGEPGAFIARDDKRFNTSPAFGYAGFVIPEDTTAAVDAVRGSFTYESKLHFCQRDVADLHRSELFQHQRPRYPQARGQMLGDRMPLRTVRRLRG
jgi:hypothetical protein